MKEIYEHCAEAEKLAPLVREIAWSHNVVVFQRCENSLQKEFDAESEKLSLLVREINRSQIA